MIDYILLVLEVVGAATVAFGVFVGYLALTGRLEFRRTAIGVSDDGKPRIVSGDVVSDQDVLDLLDEIRQAREMSDKCKK